MGERATGFAREQDPLKSNHLPRIAAVAALPPLQLVIRFDDDRVVLADLRELAKRGNAFARWGEPEYLRRVRIINHGRALAWPQGLDLCADSLYMKGVARRPSRSQASPIGATIFTPSAELLAGPTS